jgi:hypothetical protein
VKQKLEKVPGEGAVCQEEEEGKGPKDPIPAQFPVHSQVNKPNPTKSICSYQYIYKSIMEWEIVLPVWHRGAMLESSQRN